MLEPEGTEVLISRPARANVIKLFTHVIYSQTKQVRVLSLASLSSLVQRLVVRPEPTNVEHLSGASLEG
jgi:hypothetical protein